MEHIIYNSMEHNTWSILYIIAWSIIHGAYYYGIEHYYIIIHRDLDNFTAPYLH